VLCPFVFAGRHRQLSGTGSGYLLAPLNDIYTNH